MRIHLALPFMVALSLMLFTPVPAEDQAKSKDIDPNKVVMRWKKVGLTVEIPWRKSKLPDDDYTYISQARGFVGSPGPSSFKTEVECDMLGHSESKPFRVSVGLEVWNVESEDKGYNLAVKAINAIGVAVPDEIISAFKAGDNLLHGDWEVADESSDRLKEIRVYYRPGSSDAESDN